MMEPAHHHHADRPPRGKPLHVYSPEETRTYRFCPKCGGGLEMRVVKPQEPERRVCGGCEYIFYMDPKVAVGAICAHEGRIVLVQRAIEPAYGKWVFPGGYVDWGEPVQEAARREAREEANVDIRIDGLLNVYSYPGRGVVVIVFAASVVGGEPMAQDESLDMRLVRPEEIPWADLAFPSTRDALRDYLARGA